MTNGPEAYRTRVVDVVKGGGECIIANGRIIFRWDGYGVEQLPLIAVQEVWFSPDYGRTMFRKGTPIVAIHTLKERWAYTLHTDRAKELASRIEDAMLSY
jgi:hypothetical protein